LQTVIDRDRLSIDSSERYSNVVIDRFKRVKERWYLLYVKNKDDTALYTMVLGDFYQDSAKLRVFVRPGARLPSYNISNRGIPYEIIDEINKNEVDD
jgi:hypothetical protein